MEPVRTPETIARAIAAAQRLPYERKGMVRQPFPVTDGKRAYGGRVSKEEALEAPIEDVPLRRLEGVQRGVSLRRLEQHVRSANVTEPGYRTPGGYPKDLPIVVKVGDRMIVHDGHHRLTAAKLLGGTEARARVVTMNPHPMTLWAHR